MELYAYPFAKQVIVCGDIHGNFGQMVHKLCTLKKHTDTLLIVAGDCGFGNKTFGYYENEYMRLERKLRKNNNWIAFVRGNHDDPSYFEEKKIDFKRWRTVPDYAVIQAAGHNILCIGGAISLTRALDIENDEYRSRKDIALYWKDEAPSFKPEAIDRLPEEISIDTIVTHTAPSRCELTSKAEIERLSIELHDPTLLRDCTNERKTMDDIESHLRAHGHPLQNWFYGHFHASWTKNMDGTTFNMLDVMELKKVPNTTNSEK